jgi:hypothetical protein
MVFRSLSGVQFFVIEEYFRGYGEPPCIPALPIQFLGPDELANSELIFVRVESAHQIGVIGVQRRCQTSFAASQVNHEAAFHAGHLQYLTSLLRRIHGGRSGPWWSDKHNAANRNDPCYASAFAFHAGVSWFVS